MPGKFPKTSVVELPGLFKSAEEASLALWRLYESGFLKDEYDEVKPLAIAPMTGNRIHTRTPIGDVSALSGKKAGKTLGDDFGMIAGLVAITAWRFGF